MSRVCIEEKLRVNVWSEGLKQLHLPVGPWLNEAKRLVRRGAADDAEVVVNGERSVRLDVLRETALARGADKRSPTWLMPPGTIAM